MLAPHSVIVKPGSTAAGAEIGRALPLNPPSLLHSTVQVAPLLHSVIVQPPIIASSEFRPDEVGEDGVCVD